MFNLLKQGLESDSISAYWIYDHQHEKLNWSNGVYALLGMTPEDMAPSRDFFLSYLPSESARQVESAFQEALLTCKPYQALFPFVKPDQTEEFLIESGFHECDGSGCLVRSFGILQNVSQQAAESFHLKRYLSLVNQQIIMSRTDLTGKILEVSDRFCEISGYSREELVGQSHNFVRHPDMSKEVFAEVWRTIKSGQVWEGEIKNLCKDGSYYWVASKISPDYDHLERHIGYISLRVDITAQKRLEEISVRDEMTGLYNRRFYNQQLHLELSRAKRDKSWLCFIMIDADNFKKYNDTYGHQMGDEVLKSIARTMKQVFQRAGDFCFRLGGEEFAVLYEVKERENAKMMAERLRQALFDLAIEHSGNEPYKRVTISIGGVLMFPVEDYLEEEIYKYADSALYQAKGRGRNRIEFIEEEEIELF